MSQGEHFGTAAEATHHEGPTQPHPRGQSGLWFGVLAFALIWMGVFGLTWWIATQF